MLTEDEARTVYDELIKKLRAIEAVDLLSQISTAVGVGRVQLRERDHIQERLPAVFALEIALLMLAAWIEPTFLISEAHALLCEASGAKIAGMRWEHDRLEFVESEARAVAPVNSHQYIEEIPQFGTTSDEIRRYVERLHAIAKELGVAEEG